MKRSLPSISKKLAVLVLCSVLGSLHAQEANQVVSLQSGWNAVWLEVEPQYPATHAKAGQAMAPEDLFSGAEGMAVQIAATPKPFADLSEFFAAMPVSAETIQSENANAWQEWNRTDPSGQNNLPAMVGNRPYLIKASAAVNIALTGKVRFHKPVWTADRFNLIGFGFEGVAPSFDDFFGPSGGKHPVAKIYKLNAATGGWATVNGGDSMVSGRAYWVFSNGPSAYMGPVAVDFDRSVIGELSFGGPADAVKVGEGVDELQLDLEELVFTNLGTAPATPELDLITADPGAGSLALYVVRPAVDRLAYERGNQIDSAAGAGGSSSIQETVAPSSSVTLTIGARRLWTTGAASRRNVYRVNTGVGSASFWLPISALNGDIQDPTDLVPTGSLASAGLWVGEAIVNSVTSIVENGAPVRPAAGNAPIRVILHSDGGGAVRLLSSVTLMQTKTADAEVQSEQVLVVDPNQIPFFEGVKVRNGKRVGIRVQSVAYGMPRKIDAASQAALLSDPAYPGLTEAGISDFLLARLGRPPSLAEVYHLSWPMTGAVGSGKTVEGTLLLDPFHRSNPFRHAFHKTQAKGVSITRTMSIVFDEAQSSPDRLLGTFTETVQGLIQSNLILSGPVEMRRISPVAVLEGAE